MSPINSRAKGARFERGILKLLEAATGLAGRRTSDGQAQIHRGDIIHPLLEDYHPELKHREQIALKDWIAQAEREAAPGKEPIVIWRTNSTVPYINMKLSHFIDLLLRLRGEGNDDDNPAAEVAVA